MKSSEYWRKRFEILEEAQLKKGQDYYAQLDRQYRQAADSVEKEIARWYIRFAENNEITLAKAKRLLNGKELAELRWNVKQYIKFGRENALNQRWLKQLENASARFHITRLEALKLQIQQQAEVLFGNQVDGIDALVRKIYSDGYYHTAYEIQKGFNVGWDLQPLNDSAISKVISKPWTTDERTFKDRCWTSKRQLVNTVYTDITQSIIRGDAPDKAIRNIAHEFDVGNKKAGRLVMTESAFFASQAQKDCFKDLDVEKYEIVATLDSHTSSICQDLDGKVFPMKDYEPGVTAPPFHCWCRSCTVPYFEDDYGTRAARDTDGKTYYVPNDMKYKEWFDKYVQPDEKAILQIKKDKNLITDKKQYDKYRKVLGSKNVPKSLDDFQQMKYTDNVKWFEYKATYRKTNAYNKIIQNEPEITQDLKAISEKTGVKMVGLEYRIKTKVSFLRKVDTESHNSLDFQAIDDTIIDTNDVIRYTYQAESEDLVGSYSKVINELDNKKYTKIKVKNTWTKKYIEYKGVNCTFRHPGGQKFEIQFHTPESFAIKNGKMHKLYEEYRTITDKSSDKAKSLKKQMLDLSKNLIAPKNIERVK